MTEFLKQCAKKDTLTAEDRKRLVEVADKVEEVVHAEWIEFQGEYHCSHCQRLAPLNAYREHTMRNDYCHNCGAKMDGQKREEK